MSNVSEANQYTNDEREQKCWDLYLQSILDGKVNACRAAIEAGYSEDHSRNITMQGWFKARLLDLEDQELLSKSEKKFKETLDYQPVDSEGKLDVPLLRTQTDVAKFLAETLGKKRYSKRSEHTGPDGKELPTPILSVVTKE